jgi:hypothetical protein
VTDRAELTVAFGPVGATGLVLLAASLVRRSPALAVLGAAAVWADVRYPELRGFGAARATVS